MSFSQPQQATPTMPFDRGWAVTYGTPVPRWRRRVERVIGIYRDILGR